MTFTVQTFMDMAWRSVTEPRAVTQELINAGVPQAALWPALIVVVLLSTVVSGGLNLLSPATGGFAEMMGRPFVSALLTFSLLVMTIFSFHWTGRMFGGQGRLRDMILVMTWLQAVLFVAQMIVVLVALALPPLGALLLLGLFGAAFWMAVAFVDAVHGFDNYMKGLGVIVFGVLAIAVGLSILLTFVGVSAEGFMDNV